MFLKLAIMELLFISGIQKNNKNKNKINYTYGFYII